MFTVDQFELVGVALNKKLYETAPSADGGMDKVVFKEFGIDPEIVHIIKSELGSELGGAMLNGILLGWCMHIEVSN